MNEKKLTIICPWCGASQDNLNDGLSLYLSSCFYCNNFYFIYPDGKCIKKISKDEKNIKN